MNKKMVIGLSIGLVTAILLFSILIIFISRTVLNNALKGGPDQEFGDQYLKTCVALIELHKVRYGSYPASLNDLKFVGEWDKIALRSVSYYTNGDRTTYYVEVQTGWVGKPELSMSDEFWQGTGYDESLKP